MSTYNATLTEQGNGFPQDGALAYDSDSDTVYRIVRTSRIHTSGARANYVYADVTPANLHISSLSEDEVSDCRLSLLTSETDEQ